VSSEEVRAAVIEQFAGIFELTAVDRSANASARAATAG
jgi:hypothetical protein